MSSFHELRQISDQWLDERMTREKRFSLGFFEPDYLRRMPMGLVWYGEKLVAFANMWVADGKEEMSVDLMRHTHDAPHGVMDYLFINLMQWGGTESYQWFNLGMAPLAGLEAPPTAPLWNRIGSLAFQRGEAFYNFKGLRQYKEKFHPVWSPKFVASPRNAALPIVLANIATLISGTLRGNVTR